MGSWIVVINVFDIVWWEKIIKFKKLEACDHQKEGILGELR